MLFSWVSIMKDVLMDQGTPFMSKLMVDLCLLLQVKHLRMSFGSMLRLMDWWCSSIRL